MNKFMKFGIVKKNNEMLKGFKHKSSKGDVILNIFRNRARSRYIDLNSTANSGRSGRTIIHLKSWEVEEDFTKNAVGWISFFLT